MLKMLIGGAMALVSLGGCPGPVDEAPVLACPAGGIVVLDGQAVDCDLAPTDTLVVVFNDASEGPGWGGDASVAAAAEACDDMGGTQVWLQQPYRLACVDVDF